MQGYGSTRVLTKFQYSYSTRTSTAVLSTNSTSTCRGDSTLYELDLVQISTNQYTSYNKFVHIKLADFANKFAFFIKKTIIFLENVILIENYEVNAKQDLKIMFKHCSFY